MNRETALAPLGSNQGRFKFTAGIFVRGSIRQFIVARGLDYYEEKGFLESLFVVKGPVHQIQTTYKEIQLAFPDTE